MDASLNSCGIASFHYMHRNNSVSFSAIGSPTALKVYISRQELYPRLVLCQKTDEPRHEQTNILVSDLVRHKPGSSATEDGYRLKSLDLASRGVVLSM